MNKIEKDILECYERDYKVEALSYQIMGMMLNEKYVEKRLGLFNINDMYIYGGTYMAIQLYQTGKKYADIKGIVDKSGRVVLNENVPVMLLDELRNKYKGEKIVVTPLRYFQEIEEELKQFVDVANIIDIGELLLGLAYDRANC